MIYDRDQHISLLLAGTVALPSPFPAAGRLSVGVHVHDEGDDPEIFLEIEQVVDVHRTIFRILRFEDVRAIRASDGSIPAHEAPLLTARQIASKVGEKSKLLANGRKEAGGPGKELLFKQAIVYVPETCPVLHRVHLGLTAGESAEDFGVQGQVGCCGLPEMDSH